MQDLYDEPALRRLQRQLNHEVEHSIREANREIIHARIPELDRDQFLRFAIVVARLRADYLSAALQLVEGGTERAPDAASIARLREQRQAFEEARDAFEALKHAAERGYLDLGAAV